MRLWHKDLIPYLPKNQLLGQWRECCLIAKNIAEKGTPNHILVNRIMDYPIEHFICYSRHVFYEMKKRGYNAKFSAFSKYVNNPNAGWNMPIKDLFPNWHDDMYYTQCYYNLQEKYCCGAISFNEWIKIRNPIHYKHPNLYMRELL